jgi:membrane protein
MASLEHLTARLRRHARPVEPFIRATRLWSDAGGMRMSAAMSFYGMLSLAPLLLVIVGVLGWWLDRQLLQQTLVEQVAALVGPQGAAAVRQALASAQEPSQGIVATVFGFAVLLFGATGVFGELQEAFARVWSEGGPVPRPGWWHTASLRLRGVAYILVFGFLMLVSLVVSTLLTVFSGWLGERFALETLLRGLNELVAFGLCAALFVSLMRLSAGRKPGLRFLVLGGVVGALLFGVGRQLLSWYLATAAVVSAYGAAGSLVVVLMWIYFSSAVLLFAASCAKAAEQVRQEAAAARAGPGRPPPLRVVAGTRQDAPARRRAR